MRDTFYHTPFANSRWQALAPRDVPRAYRENSERTKVETEGIRSRMVSQAKALLSDGANGSGFGGQDLEMMLSKASASVEWKSSQGLDALVSLGRKKRAFHLDDSPEPGDIVLFHNQLDANLNGETDDWLTGCGVVTKRDGARFVAVVRTGNAPRKVVVWPDGPARRIVDGEQVNSFLRVPSRSDPEDTPYLAGQLYAGYLDIEQLSGDAR